MCIRDRDGAVITTYASSAKNSETRQIYINEQPYDVTKDTISSYVYEGEDSTIDIYAGAGINLYGISAVSYTHLDVYKRQVYCI